MKKTESLNWQRYLKLFFILIATGKAVDIYFQNTYGTAIALIFSAIGIYNYNYLKWDKDTCNIDGVFIFIWVFSLGLSNLRLSEKQYAWDFRVWLVLILSILSYVIGSVLVEKKIFKYLSIGKISYNQVRDNLRYRKNLLFLFSLSIIAFVIEVFVEGFIPIFAIGMNSYIDFGIKFVHYATVSMAIIVVMMLDYLSENKQDKLIKVCALIGTLQVISLVSRQLVLLLLVGIMVVYNYKVKKTKLKTVIFGLIAVLVFFGIMGKLRNQSLDYLYYVAEIKDWVPKTYLMWPYTYITMGFENMRSLINTPINHTYGIFTFTPFWALTRLVNFLPEVANPEYLTIKEFTVSTYLNILFIDFGWIGITVFPFIVGMVNKWVYVLFKENEENRMILLLYFILFHNSLFIFFVNFYSNTSIIVGIMFILFATLFKGINYFDKDDTFGK